jgi:hypothetical protein
MAARAETVGELPLIRDLSSGAQVCVWALRTRLVCKRKAEDPRPRIDHGFQLAGVPEAARDFDQLFDWLDGAATQPVAIGCFCCKQVSPDEACVLAALAAAQAGDANHAQAQLGRLLSPVAAHEATRAAVRLAGALARVELPVEPAGRPATADAAGGGDAALAGTPGPAPNAPGSTAVH